MKAKYGERVKVFDPGRLGAVLISSETKEFTIKFSKLPLAILLVHVVVLHWMLLNSILNNKKDHFTGM